MSLTDTDDSGFCLVWIHQQVTEIKSVLGGIDSVEVDMAALNARVVCYRHTASV